MNDAHTALRLEQLRSQTQFACLQLALAAGAIAFALHETEGRSLHDTPWPIGAAVLCWVGSFALGCLGVTSRQRALGAEAEAVAPAFVSQRQLSRPPRRFRWQLLTLSAGALFYLAGHVMHMAAKAGEGDSVALPYDIHRPPFPGRGPR